MELEELAGRFVEIFVVEFGDAPLFAFHLGAAVVVEFLGCGTNGSDELGGWGLGEREGFKTGVVSVGNICFKRGFLGVHPGSMRIGCENTKNIEVI